QFYAQRRQAAVRSTYFIAIFNRTQTIRRGQSFIHRRLIMAEEKGGSQLEPRALYAFENAVDDVNGILQMQHQNTFLEHEVAHMICPDGQPVFEAEFMQVIGRAEIKLATCSLFRAEGDDVIVCKTQELRNVTPHHHAAVWSWQCGDEQAVIPPCDCGRNRARSETTESICHKPLPCEQQFARMTRFIPWHGSGGESHFAPKSKNR